MTGPVDAMGQAMAQLRSALAREDRMGYHSLIQGAARRVLAAYDGDTQVALPTPMACIVTADDRNGKRWYRLNDAADADGARCLVLDPPLEACDMLQGIDVGDGRVDLVAMVRNHRLRFALNMHCGKCGTFACHRLEVPPGDWVNNEPYLVRRCACGDCWRQYPKVVNHAGREVVPRS